MFGNCQNICRVNQIAHPLIMTFASHYLAWPLGCAALRILKTFESDGDQMSVCQISEPDGLC